MNIQTLLPIIIAAVVLILAGIGVWLTIIKMRSIRLKKKFGPEYDFTLDKLGDRKTAEEDLKERESRVVKLDIHPLNERERERYLNEWIEIQAEFVDTPLKSVEKANRLITEVMIARGFPVADIEQRAADLSVIYPNVVPNYRKANSLTYTTQNGNVSTEDLRQAMVYYRSTFNELAGTIEPVEREMEAEYEQKIHA